MGKFIRCDTDSDFAELDFPTFKTADFQSHKYFFKLLVCKTIKRFQSLGLPKADT